MSICHGQILEPPDGLPVWGVGEEALTTNTAETVAVTLVQESANLNNAILGLVVKPDGTFTNVKALFPATQNGDAGTTVELGTFAEDTLVGLALVSDGVNLLAGLDLDNGELSFQAHGTGQPFDLDQGGRPELVFTTPNGQETIIQTPLFFTVDPAPNQDGNPINTGGETQLFSGEGPTGHTRIAFEDVVLRNSDCDFNDAILDVAFLAELDLDALVIGPDGPKFNVFLNSGLAGNFVDAGHDPFNAIDDPQSAALGDLDGDGDLDAFLANRVFDEGSPDRVLLNDGTGTFTDTGQMLGSERSIWPILSDLDDDGDLDAFV
ncbi:MAG: FG-GAP-like repeat-containing protein, partial [Pseudomonadota bacterium]